MSGVGSVSGVSRVSSVSSVVSRVAGVHRVVELRSVRSAFEFVSRQSPRMALAPALEGLRRAAEAKRSQRIAKRLAALAGRAYGQRQEIFRGSC